MAGMAALRSGAGLVRLAIPEKILDSVAAFDPCYTTLPMSCDCLGRLSLDAEPELAVATRSATAIAIGPGLSQTPSLFELVARMYSGVPKPLVVDADALNCLARVESESLTMEILTIPEGPRILTPHPGEFARLIGHGKHSVPAKLSREQMVPIAVEKACEWKSIVVLKGAGTLVTDGVRQYINPTGNPGMATGGSGDVLTGVIVSLLAQGLDAYDAAVLGVYLHGLAGDLAAQRVGEYGMVATDIIAAIPEAFRHHQARCRESGEWGSRWSFCR